MPLALVYKLDGNSPSARPTRDATYGNELKPRERLRQYQKVLFRKATCYIKKKESILGEGHIT